MLLKNYFYEMLEINPQLGSFIGYRKYDDQYANYFSKEYEQKFKQLNMKYARMLHSKGSSSVDDEVLEFITKMNLMHNDELNLMPMTSYSNMILDFSFENTNYYPINKKNEHKRYLGFLEVLETSIQLMKTGVEKGYVIPKFICEKMIKMLKKVDLRGSDIMKRLLEFLETEYLPACRSTIGLCHLPKGKVLYKYLVMCQLTIDMPIEEIHKFGITEVKRISEELKKHKKSQQKMKNIIGAYQVQRNYISQ
jgi:uncharacterized protein (DUF885 family)